MMTNGYKGLHCHSNGIWVHGVMVQLQFNFYHCFLKED